jgi:hypothetical protein
MDRVLGAVFGKASWDGWRVVLAAIFGLPMSEAQAETYRALTGRTAVPTHQAREVWLIVGRRAGKSFISALIAIFQTCCRTYTLAPGERGVFMVIAADRKQARVVRRYIRALLYLSPVLRQLIAPEGDTVGSKGETQNSIFLTNGLVIEIHTATSSAVRGYTVVGAICDEIAFWPTDDAAHPDTAILGALRPAMATVPEALLLLLSSPYARRGELWRAYQRYFGQDDGRVLVIQAPTLTLNPTVPQDVIDQAYEDDPVAAAAEYGAEFRRDVETFIDRDVLDGAVMADRHELRPVAGVRYVAFVDPAGGSGGDAFTLAIAHQADEGRVVLDLVREQRPPFSPEATVEEFARAVQNFGLTEVTGDRYAGEWPREQFRKHGITYAVSERVKSDIYRDFLPLMNSSCVELLAVPRLVAQLAGLERRTARGGKDSIDHAPKQHDDLANAAAGACVLAQPQYSNVPYTIPVYGAGYGGGSRPFYTPDQQKLLARLATFGDELYDNDPIARDMKARGVVPIIR